MEDTLKQKLVQKLKNNVDSETDKILILLGLQYCYSSFKYKDDFDSIENGMYFCYSDCYLYHIEKLEEYIKETICFENPFNHLSVSNLISDKLIESSNDDKLRLTLNKGLGSLKQILSQ